MPYDRAELIQTYLNAHGSVSSPAGDYEPARDEYNDALRTYYQGLLAALEQLFDATLDVEHAQGIDAKILLMLFRSTADSYLAARTPWSHYLEAGLIINRLKSAGETGRRALDASDRIQSLHEESAKQHLDMLDALVETLLGDKADLVFDSAALLATGFNNSDRPDPADYPDPDYES